MHNYFCILYIWTNRFWWVKQWKMKCENVLCHKKCVAQNHECLNSSVQNILRFISVNDFYTLHVLRWLHFLWTYLHSPCNIRLPYVNGHVHKINDEQQASSRCDSKLDWWSAFHWKYFISNNLRHWKRQRWTSRVYRKGSQDAWRYSSSCSTWCIPVKMNKSCFDFLWIWQERIVFHCFCDEILTYW